MRETQKSGGKRTLLVQRICNAAKDPGISTRRVTRFFRATAATAVLE